MFIEIEILVSNLSLRLYFLKQKLALILIHNNYSLKRCFNDEKY